MSDARRAKLQALKDRALGVCQGEAPPARQRAEARPQSAVAGTRGLAQLRTRQLRETKGMVSPLIFKRTTAGRIVQPRKGGRTGGGKAAVGASPGRLGFKSLRVVDGEDSATWWDTPQTSSGRPGPTPLPSYVLRNRKLATLDAERPKERQVRKRSDISQFYLDSKYGVDRFDPGEMQAGISSGAYRRQRSDIGNMNMQLTHGHRRPMPQDPGNTGTFRLALGDVNRAAHFPDMSAAWGQ